MIEPGAGVGLVRRLVRGEADIAVDPEHRALGVADDLGRDGAQLGVESLTPLAHRIPISRARRPHGWPRTSPLGVCQPQIRQEPERRGPKSAEAGSERHLLLPRPSGRDRTSERVGRAHAHFGGDRSVQRGADNVPKPLMRPQSGYRVTNRYFLACRRGSRPGMSGPSRRALVDVDADANRGGMARGLHEMTDPLRGHRQTDQVGRHDERRAEGAVPAGHPERLHRNPVEVSIVTT